MREIAAHLTRFERSRAWRAILLNLLRTGVWSGGCTAEAGASPCRSARTFDAMFAEVGFASVEACDLYNFTLWRWDLDRHCRSRSRIGRAMAGALGWTHLGVYRRGRDA
jgi:hypothetical protein